MIAGLYFPTRKGPAITVQCEINLIEFEINDDIEVTTRGCVPVVVAGGGGMCQENDVVCDLGHEKPADPCRYT